MLALMSSATPAASLTQTEADAQPRVVDSFSLLGSYLAGRIAQQDLNLATAAEYYRRALQRDPENPELLAETFQMELGAGDLDAATALARRLVQVGGGDNSFAYLLLGVDAFANRDHDTALLFFGTMGRSPLIQLTNTLALAWTQFASGSTDRALEIIAEPHSADRSRYFVRLHSGLMADLADRPDIARENFSLGIEVHGENRRLIEAYARHAAARGDRKLAADVLARFREGASADPALAALSEELQSAQNPEFLARNAQEGLAEVFFGLAGVLSGEHHGAARVYLRLALMLNPAFDSASYLLGELETSAKRMEAALEAYQRVPTISRLHLDARIRAAFLLNALERSDEGVGLLSALIPHYPDEPRVLQAIGNILRDQKSYEQAATFYTRAIEMIGEPSREHWLYFFARGICYERIKQWEKAEPDFKKALELNPGQASVLNYLGYSWVDQNMHLEEAMDLIREAVASEPDNGYFVDSLGWAHYRLGEYDAAVEQLERAVELRPEDPVLNDHLGDAYWQVGRKREARFQWSYALTLEPEQEDEENIRHKLANGLEEPNRKAALEEPGRADLR